MPKIGIMSFAHMHTYSYGACLNALPEAEFVAVWDDKPRRGRAAARQFGATFVSKLEKFLDLDLDGVIICSENVKHREMTTLAAQAGKWVLCEKPLATNVADAHAMIKACEKAKVGLGTAFPCRFAAPLRVARDRIVSGEFGAVYAAACTNNGSNPGGWFAEDMLSGGGATMDHTVHVVDVLRWITGKEFRKVYCEAGNVLHRDTLETDDVGLLQLEMEGGAQVSHVASWSRPKSFPTWGDVTIEFICEKGVLNVDAFNQRVDVYSDAAMKAEWVSWGGNPDLGLVRDFVRAIMEKRPPCATGLDGLRATEVTVAAYESLKSGNVVKIRA